MLSARIPQKKGIAMFDGHYNEICKKFEISSGHISSTYI
jgi:hypothetical protein